MRVYCVNKNGEIQDDFGSLSFKLDLSELRRERRFYETLATMSMWALLILLVGVLLLARQARIQQAVEPATQAEPRTTERMTTRRGSETKRYDYHSMIGLHRISFAVITVMLLATFSFYVLISRGLTLVHKQFIPAALLGHFVSSFFMYLHLKRSYIEISARGIMYQGMIRNIHSPWVGIKKISVYGSTSRIVTDDGNFSIGAIEPADNPPRGWLDLLRPRRLKFHKELIEEMQKNAPQAKVSISWLVKLRWQRL
jgi:hypothetical protein